MELPELPEELLPEELLPELPEELLPELTDELLPEELLPELTDELLPEELLPELTEELLPELPDELLPEELLPEELLPEELLPDELLPEELLLPAAVRVYRLYSFKFSGSGRSLTYPRMGSLISFKIWRPAFGLTRVVVEHIPAFFRSMIATRSVYKRNCLTMAPWLFRASLTYLR